MLALRNPNDPRNVKEVVDALVRQFDNTGSFSLAVSQTTTVVRNPKINSLSKVFLEPRTAAAKSSDATTWISSISDGQFVVSHTSATTDRKYDYVVFGV